MKIKMICKRKGHKVATDGKDIYYAEFAVAVDEKTFFGDCRLESTEPLHFKVKKMYDINIDTSTDIVTIH